ncbi:MAG: ABC transporter ATP-binding protein [Clostridia bacterium]|nr:ABC transporter ATP-binding protein [Clostridia bacterium]
MNDTYFISAEHMTVGYDGKPLIENIEIGVRRGEILTLIGPNGSGKSTILKSVIKQLRLLAGTVVLDEQDMAGLKERDVAKKLAIVMTDCIRPELMTCWDVAATGRYPYTGRLGILSEEDKRIVDAAMATVRAQDFQDADFSRISDGQRQRILLARAIAQQPEVIVLDEPTSFLDVRHKLELLDILKRMVREQNVAVIVSLHELDLAEKISDRVVCVAHNRIDRCDTPEAVFSGDYIKQLYGIERGTFHAAFGSLEMARVEGEPKVFVIGGGGSGIPVYRFLQRANVPFAAGVIQQNDVEYPVANALAAELVSVPAFAVIDDEAIERAKQQIDLCKAVVTTVEIGETNRANEQLIAYALDKRMDTESLFDAVREGRL